MKLLFIHFILLSLITFLLNYCYASTTNEESEKFFIEDTELIEQMNTIIQQCVEMGGSIEDAHAFIEKNLKNIIIIPSSNNVNVDNHQVVEDNSVKVDDRQVVDDKVNVDDHQVVVEDKVKIGDHQVVVDDKVKIDDHQDVVDDKAKVNNKSFTVNDIVKKIETDRVDKNKHRFTKYQDMFGYSDNETVVKSLQELKDFTLTSVPTMSNYIPVKDSVFAKKHTASRPHSDTRTTELDNTSAEIKGIVSEILELIRTSYQVSKNQNKNIEELINKYNENNTNNILPDLVDLVTNLEKEKFPFTKDEEFIKHATDKNPESITYSDIHENKWKWRAGDNSVDNFNTTIEKRISGDYRKNNMLVRFHKIIRDNKISDTYEEVINDNPTNNPVTGLDKSDNVENNGPVVNQLDTSNDDKDMKSNGISNKNFNLYILIPILTMFIL